MVKVGRAINGITINGVEWLLTEDYQIMTFENEDAAKTYLKEHGIQEDMLDEFVYEGIELEKI